jgi:hypothetical protein
VSKKLRRSPTGRARLPVDDHRLEAGSRPPPAPILAIVQEEAPGDGGALELRVSLRSPGGRVVETRTLRARPEGVDAALTELAVGWAAALESGFGRHPVRVVRGLGGL